jgi:hypothetical protein
VNEVRGCKPGAARQSTRRRGVDGRIRVVLAGAAASAQRAVAGSDRDLEIMKIFRKSGRIASHLSVPAGARAWIAPVPKPRTEGSMVTPPSDPSNGAWESMVTWRRFSRQHDIWRIERILKNQKFSFLKIRKIRQVRGAYLFHNRRI